MKWILLIAAFTCTLQAAEPVTVLPFGDSITQGSSGFSCYRPILKKQLGDRIRFVGPKTDADGLRHAGYGGHSSDKLKTMVEKIYRAHPADIVLLHAGHNHFSDKKPIARIVANTRTMIATIQRINPKVIILLAQVIPAGKLPKYSYIPELNRALEPLAAERVILVDHAAGFDWEKDTVKDKVHPNQRGAEKMAKAWAKALEPVLTSRP